MKSAALRRSLGGGATAAGAGVAVLVTCALPAMAAAQTTDKPIGALQELTVTEAGCRVVIALAADQALEGQLEAIIVPPVRIYVDLPKIVPEVDRVVDVHRGAVQRVRVALNQSTPPVTRVVLDLERTATYFLERGETDHTLRIVVDGSGVASSTTVHDYSDWFTEVTGTIARLLKQRAVSSLDGPDTSSRLERMAVEWRGVHTDLENVTPPVSFLEAHRALTTSAVLGHATVTERLDGSLPSGKPSAVEAGARLSLSFAQELAGPCLAGMHGVGTEAQ